mmetsp:Transcript_46032/g.72051  ORF Transcript_46032/g.72051 Transcript_46032/m.72051 type:complete len:620 (+) Transcript_46032:97-1956(+)
MVLASGWGGLCKISFVVLKLCFISKLSQEAAGLEEGAVPKYLYARARFAGQLDEVVNRTEGVRLLNDTFLPPPFNKPPSLMFSSEQEKERQCKVHKWLFCEEAERDTMVGANYWTASARTFMLSVKDAYVLPNAGLIRHNAYYYVFGHNIGAEQNVDQKYGKESYLELKSKPKRRRHFSEVLYISGFRGSLTHFMEMALCHLLWGLRYVPPSTPVLLKAQAYSKSTVGHMKMVEQIIELLEDVGVLSKGQVEYWNKDTLYQVDTLWTPGEMCFENENTGWRVRTERFCAGRLYYPMTIVRDTFLPLVSEAEKAAKASNTKKQIVVIDRSDAKSRRITNNKELLESLQLVMGENAEILNVQNTKLSLREQFSLYLQTDVLVGPHGCGLIHGLMLPPGGRAVVVEVGYNSLKGFRWPLYYFQAILLSAGVPQYVSVSKSGSYKSPMVADISDLTQIFQNILSNSSVFVPGAPAQQAPFQAILSNSSVLVPAAPAPHAPVPEPVAAAPMDVEVGAQGEGEAAVLLPAAPAPHAVVPEPAAAAPTDAEVGAQGDGDVVAPEALDLQKKVEPTPALHAPLPESAAAALTASGLQKEMEQQDELIRKQAAIISQLRAQVKARPPA